jgi:hypothetical protein
MRIRRTGDTCIGKCPLSAVKVRAAEEPALDK